MASNKSEFIRTTTATTANSDSNDIENGHDVVDFIVNNNNNSINYEHQLTTKVNDIYNKNNATVPNKQIVPKSNNNNNNNNNSSNSPSQRNGKQTQIEPKTPPTPTATATTTTTTPTEQSAASKHKNKVADKERKEQRISIFSFGRKLSQKTEASAEKPAPLKSAKSSPLLLPPTPPVPIGTPPRQHKFVKSSSLARLLGNTYNAKKFEREEQKRLAGDGKFNTYSGRRRQGPYLERFKRFAKDDGDVASSSDAVTVTGVITLTTDSRDLFGGSRNELVGTELPELAHHQHPHQYHHIDDNMGAKAMRTISRGLGKLWWKRTHSVDISTPDPEFKVSYLGNVLTGWAKGEGCVEKQLNTLWRNYTQNNKPDVLMRIKVCASGLKATTRQHGLTEYWANRITYCCAPKNYPRVVCWIYRHEGRKLKHELRCHAVLCSKEKIAHDICETLKENLESALREFKRDKILKQNARLSLANAVYDNPSLPRRKIMLSVGGNNYRPPLERSKSAPKLMAIEEAIGEEGDEIEETNEPEMKPCCQKDSLYPAMTLGRRRCRRGHSIRRTGKTRPTYLCSQSMTEAAGHCCGSKAETKVNTELCHKGGEAMPVIGNNNNNKQYGSDGSDSDDFEKLLKYNNYDANTTLSTELLPYFDMQLHKNISQSLGSLSELKDHDDDEEEPLSLLPTINSDPSADPEAEYATMNETTSNGAAADGADNMVSLRRSGICSDGEEDYLDDADDMYFRQAAILNMLHRNSMRKMQNLSLSSDENSSIETNASAQLQYRHHQQSSISSNSSGASGASTTAAALAAVQDASSAVQRKQLNPDSDEGSISSGCETASTVTNNQDDVSLKYRRMQPQLSASGGLENMQRLNEYGILDEAESTNAAGGGTEVDLQDMYQRLESRLQHRHNSDATTYSSSSSITLKMGNSPATSVTALDVGVINTSGSHNNNNCNNNNNNNSNTNNFSASTNRSKRTRKHSSNRDQQQNSGDSDSECSDESGYVEFQEQRNSGNVSVSANKPPHPPPKPMPRRMLNAASSAV